MNEAFLFGPYRLDPQSRLLQRSQVEISLGGRAFDVLTAMVERSGQVLSHRELMTIGWPNVVVEESSIRVQIAMLRRKLGCGRDGIRYIASVAGRGYCFVARTQRVQADEVPNSLSVQAMPSQPEADALQLIASAPSRLPAPLERALGREENIPELSRMIMEHRFVTVLGPGGVGKTTLAILVAHALEDVAVDVCFVDLSGVEDSTLVADAIASAVALKSVGGDPLQSLQALSENQRTLIVLDNCEHLISTVASLAESLIRQTQRVYVLATSREALRVRGEFIYLLRPLGVPPHTGRLTARQAMAWPAVQLFMERASDGGHLDSLTDEQAATVAAICRRLDGNPLGIELIASRVATYGIQGVADLLGNQMVLSWRGRRDAPPRHQTVEAMLDWSYNLLPDRDRRVLHRLSIFVGQFSLQAAISVAADEDIGVAELVGAINDLVDKSLIAASSTDGNTALRLLDTTRTYAALKLAGTPDSATISRKHALYCAAELLLGLDDCKRVVAFAESLSASGEHDEAILEIDNALDLAEQGGCTLTLFDLLRTKAEMLLARAQTDSEAVKELQAQARYLAGKQASLSPELGAALTLTRRVTSAHQHTHDPRPPQHLTSVNELACCTRDSLEPKR